MKALQKLQRAALLAVALLGSSSAVQALTSSQAGAWTDAATWGGTVPAFSTSAGAGDNLEINHAITVGNTNVSVRDLNLKQTTGGSISITGTGKVYLNWDVNLGVRQWNTSSGYNFNNNGRQIRFYSNGGKWTHNGTLNPGAATDIFSRPTGGTVTVDGTGTLSLDRLVLSTSAHTFNIDRNLTANALEFQSATNVRTLNLQSGTTQFDSLINPLGVDSLVNLASTTAVLRVKATALSVEAAQAAIAIGYITKTVSGSGANSIQATAVGSYTVIATSNDPPLAAPALYLEAPIVDTVKITTHDATVSALLTSPNSSHNNADITIVWSAAGDQGTTLVAWGANTLASGNFTTGADVTANFDGGLDRNITYTFRLYASNGADKAWSQPATVTTLATDFVLPKILSNNMLLQRNKPIRIWGKGDNGGTVTVTFKSQTKQTTVANGVWMVTLDAEPAGGPYTMRISHDELVLTEKTINNILVGEVWRAAGQSNMEWAIGSSKHKAEVQSLPTNDNLRMFTAPKDLSAQPEFDYKSPASWMINGQDSAIAYHFARDLQTALTATEGTVIPVGIILTKDGGTKTQCWTPIEMLINMPGFELDAARAIDDRDHTDPLNYLVAKSFSVYYNGMLYPTLPYTFRGVIWYQGESQGNTAAESLAYRRHFPLMIQSWRDAFQEPNLPFYFVQLPRASEGPYASDRAPIRESQLLSERDLPNTGMVVTMDVIDFTVDGQLGVYPSPLDGADYGLHPPFKMPIGLRLSAMARKLTYGENVAYTAPRVSDISVVGSKMVISFDHTSGGLISRDGQALRHFTICDTAAASPTATATFVAADAVIVGNTIEVSATGITHPIAVRYAWRNDANLNLYWTQDPGSYNPASYDPVNDDPAEYGPTDPRVSVWTKFFAISPFRSDAFEIAGNTRDRNFVADGDVYWVVNVDPTDPDTCYAVIADSTTLIPQTRTVSFDEGTESGVWHVYDQVTGASNTLGAIGSNKAALNLSIPAGGERVLRLVRAGDVETYSTYAAGISWGGTDSSETGDAEGDGRNNRFEYAFGSDPLSGADAPALRGQAVEEAGRQYLKLSYFENVLASDLSYSFQQSHNLTNWSLFVPAPEDVTVTPVAGSAYQKVTIRVPISGDSNFLKVGAQ